MRFYGREKEIEILRKERELSLENSRFTVITGRRRIGKTELIDHALNDGVGSYVYLLLTRQTEKNIRRSPSQYHYPCLFVTAARGSKFFWIDAASS